MVELSRMDAQSIKGIAPQERDFQLLRELYASRVMTIRHAATIVFEGRIEAARKRVQKLKRAGLIRDRLRDHSEPSALQLAKKGYGLLKQHHALQGFPVIGETAFELRSRVSPLTLRHELAVMDVKTALVAALTQRPDIQVMEAVTWPLLCQFTALKPRASGYGSESVVVKPDGFLCFRQKAPDGVVEHACFIEVDRGTASQRILTERAACYRTHYRSGGFAEARGGKREDSARYPFRVLIICKTEDRSDNLAVRMLALDPPIKSMVWLTTMAELSTNPLGSIWIRPSDHEASHFTADRLGNSHMLVRIDHTHNLATSVENRSPKVRLIDADRHLLHSYGTMRHVP